MSNIQSEPSLRPTASLDGMGVYPPPDERAHPRPVQLFAFRVTGRGKAAFLAKVASALSLFDLAPTQLLATANAEELTISFVVAADPRESVRCAERLRALVEVNQVAWVSSPQDGG